MLHGGLVLANFIWSSLHILMSIPLRQGKSATVLSLYREIVGLFALSALALWFDRAPGTRPPLTKRHLVLLSMSGLLSALIRVTIIAALENAGPTIVASVVPSTPSITMVCAIAAGMEVINVHKRSGELICFGLALTALCALSMGLWKGPRLFGSPPSGSHAPADAAYGTLLILLNCLISSLVQIVNKKLLLIYPLMSATALTEVVAVFWLGIFAAASAPATWAIDGPVVAACLFGGLLATALNNVSLARANSKLGPVVVNLYVPLQPLFTTFLDAVTLGDAVYLANAVCGAGIISGLLIVKTGKLQQLQEIGEQKRKTSSADLSPDDEPPQLTGEKEVLLAVRGSSEGWQSPTRKESLRRDSGEALASSPAELSEAERLEEAAHSEGGADGQEGV